MGLSPWSTLISTEGWLSEAVENICDFLVGMVVFLSINLVNTWPSVSIPRDKGVTSSSSTSLTSPPKTPPWIAAPTATTSSGLTPFEGTVPDLINMPPGCPLKPRCCWATEECARKFPKMEEVEPGHFVACYHPLFDGS